MKISIIGQGNVGTHLQRALSASKEHEVKLESSRDMVAADASADLHIIAVKDDAIEDVARKLKSLLGEDYAGVVAHTAGSKPLRLLSRYFKNSGVFYPLQTFSKDVDLSYDEIPVFIEATDEDVEKKLRKAAASFTNKIYQADSEKRKCLHIGAVFSCNFVNHLLGESEKILDGQGFPLEVLKPLVVETLRKAMTESPSACQTGPARRADYGVITGHLIYLDKDREAQNLYRTLTNSIMKKYHNE